MRFASREFLCSAALAGACALVLAVPAATAHDDQGHHPEKLGDQQTTGGPTAGIGSRTLGPAPCIGGEAGPFACRSVDLASWADRDALWPGGGLVSDLWGWTDPESGREYALVGMERGMVAVDISAPDRPVVIGRLEAERQHFFRGRWRDIKTYRDHAFVVSESFGHGLQITDLRLLRDVEDPPVFLPTTARYRRFGNAHNIAIDETSGFAYVVGTNTCSGGLHIIDVRDPARPRQAGCVGGDGYTHDAQCLTYAGPDSDYTGREICFAFNEDTVTIWDVTDKQAPVLVSRTGYPDRGYTHQGWVTEDQAWLISDDETDELRFGNNTRTLVWDIRDLDGPRLHFDRYGPSRAIDHNQYVTGRRLFQANYRAGLRILGLGCGDQPEILELGHFDVFPSDDATRFSGAWSNYPWFESGVVAVSSIEQGLFVLQPTGRAACPDDTPPTIEESEDDLGCLWPPDHEYTCFGRENFRPVLSDDCGGEVAWSFHSCISDEPEDADGDGQTVDDCFVTVDGDQVCLRAERAGGRAEGRRYTLRIQAVDSCGNASVGTLGRIHVPHDAAVGSRCRGAGSRLGR